MTSFNQEIYYRHVDGGYYRFMANAKHSDDASAVVVYEHIWPFEPSVWVRPAAEFAARFQPVDVTELVATQVGDRLAAQNAVNAAKAQRRARAD